MPFQSRLRIHPAEAAQQAKPPLVTKAHPSGRSLSRPSWRLQSDSPQLSERSARRARSEFCGAKAAQHAFFASFLVRTRKDVARRGESRPAALKIKMKALFAHCHSQLLCFNQKHQSTSAVTASFSRAFAIPKPIGHTAEAAQQAKQPPQGAK